MTLPGLPAPSANFPASATIVTTNAFPAGSVWCVYSDTGGPPTLFFDRYDGSTQQVDGAPYIKAGTAVSFSFMYQVT
jgi:hypothetical protein